MGLDLGYIEGQTPIDDDEREGLLIPTIATRGELDEFEQQNIEEAIEWVLGKNLDCDTIFSEKFVRLLHAKMLGHVWSWAGTFRSTKKNLGVDKWHIAVALRCLSDDAMFWVDIDTYPPDEIAIRYKHRLVSIHCFPNGNGRHSRLMADLIISKIFQRPPFSWGAGNLINVGTTRNDYIKAIREADNGNFRPLLDFSRS